MEVKVKVEKTLHTDNDKTFYEDEDIAFEMVKTGDKYIGRIKKIKKKSIIIDDIMINREPANIESMKVIVMKDDAAEADFDGVWKLSGLRVFGEALNADDYGMDSSFLTIKDGKLDIYAASEYGQSTDIPGFEMAFEDGKYVIAMDEDFANKLKDPEEEALGDSLLDTDELESKVKELTAGNNSKLELQLTEDGQLAVTCAVDVQNDYLTFSTKAIQVLADKSSEEDLDAAKKAAEEANASNDTEATTEAEDADADTDAESLGDVSIADEDAENVDVDVAADAE